jgi:hypothetical protein
LSRNNSSSAFVLLTLQEVDGQPKLGLDSAEEAGRILCCGLILGKATHDSVADVNESHNGGYKLNFSHSV